LCTLVNMSAHIIKEAGIRDAREEFADLVNEAAVRGTITYLTNRGRRVAAIVPLAIAENAEKAAE
jgi:prevent-host-death family protein